jgi:hypothetical protein
MPTPGPAGTKQARAQAWKAAAAVRCCTTSAGARVFAAHQRTAIGAADVCSRHFAIVRASVLTVANRTPRASRSLELLHWALQAPSGQTSIWRRHLDTSFSLIGSMMAVTSARTCDTRKGLFYVYFMYILCIFYVYFMYILCVFYAYFMYILCIFYVYFMYIFMYILYIFLHIFMYILCIYLCIFYVYFMYILCIFYVNFMYILCIFYVYFMYILTCRF